MSKARVLAALTAIVLGGAGVLLAAPAASANPAPTPTATPPPACPTPAATAPVYPHSAVPCSLTPAASGNTYTVTLPGVGSLTFTVDPTTNTVVAAGANAPTSTATGTNFTASTPQVSHDGDEVTVWFFNAANPKQVYVVHVHVKTTPPASGATACVPSASTTCPVIVTAIVGGRHRSHHHGDGHSSGGVGDHQFTSSGHQDGAPSWSVSGGSGSGGSGDGGGHSSSWTPGAGGGRN